MASWHQAPTPVFKRNNSGQRDGLDAPLRNTKQSMRSPSSSHSQPRTQQLRGSLPLPDRPRGSISTGGSGGAMDWRLAYAAVRGCWALDRRSRTSAQLPRRHRPLRSARLCLEHVDHLGTRVTAPVPGRDVSTHRACAPRRANRAAHLLRGLRMQSLSHWWRAKGPRAAARHGGLAFRRAGGPKP
jgi:hypothetical protein